MMRVTLIMLFVTAVVTQTIGCASDGGGTPYRCLVNVDSVPYPLTRTAEWIDITYDGRLTGQDAIQAVTYDVESGCQDAGTICIAYCIPADVGETP